MRSACYEATEKQAHNYTEDLREKLSTVPVPDLLEVVIKSSHATITWSLVGREEPSQTAAACLDKRSKLRHRRNQPFSGTVSGSVPAS